MQKIFNDIYSNDFFCVVEVENDDLLAEKISSLFQEQEIVIKILLKGKIYYDIGIMLNEKQYLIAKLTKDLRILSQEYKLFMIIIKKSLMEKLGVSSLERIIHTNLDIYSEKVFDNLKGNYLIENSYNIIEVVVNFLKIHNFIDDNIFKYSNFLEKNRYQRVFEIIEENIEMLPKDIEKRIYRELNLEKKLLEEIVYNYKKTTLEKYIFRIKLERIIEVYLSKQISLKKIAEEYNLKDTKRISSYLKKLYHITIEELKKKRRIL